jgi:hypothetical protein
MASPRPELSFLEERLSERALGALERLGARRDPSKTCDRKELARLLRQRSMPLSSAIVEFEEAVGGLVYGLHYLGVFAATCSGRKGDCSSYKGIPIVPIYLALPENGGDDQVYMDAEGRVYRTDTIALGGVIADAWTFYLERDLPQMTWRPSATPWTSVALHELMVGGVLARRFGATPLPEASDTRTRIWEAPGLRIREDEELIDFGFAATHVRSTDQDAIVEALLSVRAGHPDLMVRFWPPVARHKASASRPSGEPILTAPRLHADMGTRPVGRLVVYGEPGRYVFVEE